MIRRTIDLNDKKQTVRNIKRLVEKYAHDLKNFSIMIDGEKISLHKLTLLEFFDYVRTIKYRRDPSPVEVITRPKHIINFKGLGADCKKKAILIGSYLKLNNIPFRFVGSSKRPDKRIHHIFPQLKLNGHGSWKNFDATYNHYKPFTVKKVTNSEIL